MEKASAVADAFFVAGKNLERLGYRDWHSTNSGSVSVRAMALCYHFVEMPDKSEVTFHPIGYVRNGVEETPKRPNWQLETISDLVVDRKWEEGLDGVEGFSHLIVLFWFDRISERDVPLKVHPMHREDLPVTGLFATRAPNRPNRIGETVVTLLERKANVLRVKGLDALDGTPILDIKAYLRSGDVFPDATEPAWTGEIHA